MRPEVFIVESLGANDEREGKIIRSILRMGGKSPVYRYVKTMEGLEDAIAEFHVSDYRYLHISSRVPQTPGLRLGFQGQTGRSRCLGSRVFVFELLRIHFDAHAFLLVGNVFEGSNVVSGALLQPFVVGNHDSSGQEITLQSNRVLVVFPLR
jgi:hypothetical protein